MKFSGLAVRKILDKSKILWAALRDHFPIPVYDNLRIPKSKIDDGEEAYRGY